MIPMRSAFTAILFAVMLGAPLVSAQSPPIKVTIDANQSNQEELLRDLNSRGAKFKMTFSLVEHDFDYRIALETGKTARDFVLGNSGNVTGGTMEYPAGVAIIFDANNKELFRITHEASAFSSEHGAISGTAKDIVRRLQKWRAEHPK